MIDENTILNIINNIEPIGVIRVLFIAGLILTSTFLSVFAWVNLRNIRLLNRTLKTPLGIVLLIVGILFFAVCIGTLWMTFSLWIKPLLFS